MKKTFFLPKGLEKFSEQQINDLTLIKGGAIPIDDQIYYPTGGGGRRCLDGLVWSDKLQKCIERYLPIEEEHFKI